MRFILIALAVCPAQPSQKKRHKVCHSHLDENNMDSHEASCDDLAAEKATAMREYHRRQSFKSVLTACVVLLFFAVFHSPTLLPAVVKLFGDISRQVQAFFDNRSYVLSIVMALLFAIYASYCKNNDGVDDSGVARSPDIYKEFADNSVYCRNIIVDRCVYQEETETAAPAEEEKQIICAGNAVVLSSLPVRNDETVTETKTSCVPTVRAITANCTQSIYEKGLVEKSYRRTQSECFEKKKVHKYPKSKSSKKVMQRSEMEIHRQTVSCAQEPARLPISAEALKVLNDEEFNRKITDFIDENKLKQKKEIEDEKIKKR